MNKNLKDKARNLNKFFNNLYQNTILGLVEKYFLENFTNESFIFKQKVKIFVILNFVGFLLNLVYILITLISPSISLISNIIIAIIILTSLYLCFKGEFRKASSFFIFALITIQILNMHFINIKGNAFADDFYFLLSFLVLSSLFNTNRIMIINAAIIIFGAISFYIFKNHIFTMYRGENDGIFIVNYLFSVFIITTVILALNRIMKRAIIVADENSGQLQLERNKVIQAFHSVEITPETMLHLSNEIMIIREGSVIVPTNKHPI